MNIQHIEKGFHYNTKERELIATKIGKLATYCEKLKDESSSIRVDAEHRKTEKKRDAMKVAMTVNLPGKVLRAESRRPDAVEAIDRCVDKLTTQVKKYKEKQVEKKREVKR